ncbi:hypothetical protein LMG19089_01459 [Ralstonia edaphis]|nr:hypothetical protein LMG19089_01459 [Ralstonia sp. LMG 6871]
MVDMIVTDLTRFNNREHLCMAGLALDDNRCIRPLLPYNGGAPGYLTYAECQEKDILPGTILRVNYRPPRHLVAPHLEDVILTGDVEVVDVATSAQFHEALRASSVTTLREGFGVALPNGQKFIPSDLALPRSICTLRLRPQNFEVVADGYNPTRIRAHVTDANGQTFRFLSITDLGFYDYVGNPVTRRLTVQEAMTGIRQQRELFLRIGLSRHHHAQDGRAGYWLQVNGIYTFPDYNVVLRQY